MFVSFEQRKTKQSDARLEREKERAENGSIAIIFPESHYYCYYY